MEELAQITCIECKKSIPIDSFFCAYCGAKLKAETINTSVAKQTIIYFVSFFLAPFGLGYAIKYIKQSDPKARRIGIASLILTILGVAFMLWFGIESINEYNKILNSYNF